MRPHRAKLYMRLQPVSARLDLIICTPPNLMIRLLGVLLARFAGADTTCATGQSLIQKVHNVANNVATARDCALLVEDDCSFDTEAPNANFSCFIEHGSRLMYTTWIRQAARVLEVGARYGQTTCLISKVLNKEKGSMLFSSDADPAVWDVLEANLEKHNCDAQVIRGVVGKEDVKTLSAARTGYGKHTSSPDDPAPGILVKAHSVPSLNTTFDTLAIDCEGCFADFLTENFELLETHLTSNILKLFYDILVFGHRASLCFVYNLI